ncbi:MAG: hypothetical protein K0Q50_1490 [Vampirovibrio sp.]|jgi:hypothetical protein|nr:hypothetical protein [Vampirovibrio sp.]
MSSLIGMPTVTPKVSPAKKYPYSANQSLLHRSLTQPGKSGDSIHFGSGPGDSDSDSSDNESQSSTNSTPPPPRRKSTKAAAGTAQGNSKLEDFTQNIRDEAQMRLDQAPDLQRRSRQQFIDAKVEQAHAELEQLLFPGMFRSTLRYVWPLKLEKPNTPPFNDKSIQKTSEDIQETLHKLLLSHPQYRQIHNSDKRSELKESVDAVVAYKAAGIADEAYSYKENPLLEMCQKVSREHAQKEQEDLEWQQSAWKRKAYAAGGALATITGVKYLPVWPLLKGVGKLAALTASTTASGAKLAAAGAMSAKNLAVTTYGQAHNYGGMAMDAAKDAGTFLSTHTPDLVKNNLTFRNSGVALGTAAAASGLYYVLNTDASKARLSQAKSSLGNAGNYTLSTGKGALNTTLGIPGKIAGLFKRTPTEQVPKKEVTLEDTAAAEEKAVEPESPEISKSPAISSTHQTDNVTVEDTPKPAPIKNDSPTPEKQDKPAEEVKHHSSPVQPVKTVTAPVFQEIEEVVEEAPLDESQQQEKKPVATQSTLEKYAWPAAHVTAGSSLIVGGALLHLPVITAPIGMGMVAAGSLWAGYGLYGAYKQYNKTAEA